MGKSSYSYSSISSSRYGYGNSYRIITLILASLVIIGLIIIIFNRNNKNNKNNMINLNIIKKEEEEGYINFSLTDESTIRPIPSGMNRLDMIFFINLDNRKDRLKSIMGELNKNWVDINKVKRIKAHYTIGNGHLGCAKSHLDAILYAQKNNYENILVLEDDFSFNLKPNQVNAIFDELFSKIINNNKNRTFDWDVILLAQTYGKKEKTQYPFLSKITDAQTSSGYIVNKKYYQTMIEIFRKSISGMIQNKTSKKNYEPFALDQVWKEYQKKDNWFVFEPEIGKQNNNLISTIQQITNYNN